MTDQNADQNAGEKAGENAGEKANEKKAGEQKLLNRYVTVGSETYGPGDQLPAGVAEQITNPKAWAPADSETRPAERVQAARNAGTSSGARLATPVTVGGVTYNPDDQIPDEVAAQITNPKAWEGGKLPTAGAAKVDRAASGAAGGESAAGQGGESGGQAPADEPDEHAEHADRAGTRRSKRS